MSEPERDHGPQPLSQLMERWKLENHDLVEASLEQLTHKQVQRAKSGRMLTLKMMMKVTRAFNVAIWQRLNAADKERFIEYGHKHLHGYFLQFSLRALRKDRDGWATTSALLGGRIRAARKKVGLTQLQLAARVGVTKGTLFKWEANWHQPSRKMRGTLREIFGTEVIDAQGQRRKA